MAQAVEVGLGVSCPDQIDLVNDGEEGWTSAKMLQGILAQG